MLFLLRAACQLQSAPARKAVAVKSDGTSVPCLANFVAEQEPHGIACHFCIWLHAVPFAERGHGSIVVVADTRCLWPFSARSRNYLRSRDWSAAKSPRCHTSSSGWTAPFQRPIMASFISGRR